MAAETANYGLKKPGAEDFYNIEDFNWNADVIDAELAKRAELGEDGKVPAAQLPAMDFDPAGSAAAVQTALSGHTGDNVRHLTAAERTAWNAKAAGDHTHTAAQVGAVPTTRKVNGKALSADVTLAAADVGAAAAGHSHAASGVTAGTLAGKVNANASAAGTLTAAQVRDISVGTAELTPGPPLSSPEASTLSMSEVRPDGEKRICGCGRRGQEAQKGICGRGRRGPQAQKGIHRRGRRGPALLERGRVVLLRDGCDLDKFHSVSCRNISWELRFIWRRLLPPVRCNLFYSECLQQCFDEKHANCAKYSEILSRSGIGRKLCPVWRRPA